MSRAFTRILSNIGLSVAAVALVLIVVEVGLRLAHVSLDVHNVQFDSTLGWRGIPNFKGTFAQPCARFPITQNSRGFRDDEREFSKPDGEKRVLSIGDSFTWGWGVTRGGIYTQVLGRMLAAEGRRVEVINAGVKGYGTVQCLLYLVEEGFEYAPDVVIYQVCMNDIDENTTPMFADRWPRPYGTLTGDGELAIRGCPVPRPPLIEVVKYEAIRHSYLARYLRERGVLYWVRHLMRLERPPESVPTAAAGEVDYPFRLFAAAVRRMHEECAARGVRLVVLIDFNVTPVRMEHWHDRCADIETHFVRPYLERESEAYGVPAYIPNDNHWTPEAHTWIAQYLMEKVLPELGAPTPP